MKQEIENLLQKEMDRKSFLRHVAIGFAAIAGVSTVVKTIATMNDSGKNQAMGYGSSAYGGNQAGKSSNKQA